MRRMSKTKRILITNDDGIDSPGIIRLAETARQYGEVFVVAPAGQCSAMSQRLTLYNEMELSPINDFPVDGVQVWSLIGTPADCVKVALRVLQLHPDLLFSGINRGFNTGFDIAYSGTCGACVEGLFNAVPSFAFSNQDHDNFEVVDRMLPSLIEELSAREIAPNAYWNVNFPNCPTAELKGILYDRFPAPMQLYRDNILQRKTEDGRWMLSQRGVPMDPKDAPDGSDIHAVLHKFISVGKITTPYL